MYTSQSIRFDSIRLDRCEKQNHQVGTYVVHTYTTSGKTSRVFCNSMLLTQDHAVNCAGTGFQGAFWWRPRGWRRREAFASLREGNRRGSAAICGRKDRSSLSAFARVQHSRSLAGCALAGSSDGPFSLSLSISSGRASSSRNAVEFFKTETLLTKLFVETSVALVQSIHDL